VDIQTEVETGHEGKGKFEGSTGKTSNEDSRNIARQQPGSAVAVGKGNGVLGHLLNTAPVTSLPHPDTLTHAQLKALLTPYVGQRIALTTYDREDASTLADAAKKHSVGDTVGTLVGVVPDGVVLKKDGRDSTVNHEFWAYARIKLEDGTVLAQDPSYAKHFSD
jgi:hypothetical protein